MKAKNSRIKMTQPRIHNFKPLQTVGRAFSWLGGYGNTLLAPHGSFPENSFDLTLKYETRFWALKKMGLKCLIMYLLLQFVPFIPASFSSTGIASWYSSKDACKYNPHKGCPMANGESIYEAEKKGERFAAMWRLPFGTKVKVTNLANGRNTIVTIQDRGPAKRLKRPIDLSKLAFSDIADLKAGTINVSVEVLK